MSGGAVQCIGCGEVMPLAKERNAVNKGAALPHITR